jgi:DNA-binding Lrp family transcriptional regulator
MASDPEAVRKQDSWHGENFDEHLHHIDTGLIALLAQDGRMPTGQMAKILYSSEGTVRSRLRRLTEAGVIRVVPIVGLNALGYSHYVILCIKARDNVQAVAAQVADFPWAIGVSIMRGAYDIAVGMIAFDSSELQRILAVELASVDGVAGVESILVVETLLSASRNLGSLHGASVLLDDRGNRVLWDTFLETMPPTADSPHPHPSRSIDEVDRRIISVLRRDGRASSRQVGRALELSGSAVAKRISRMRDAGILDFAAVSDVQAIGKAYSGLLGLNVEPRRVEGVLSRASELDEVWLLSRTLGRYDLLTAITVEDAPHFERVQNELCAAGAASEVLGIGVETIKHDITIDVGR